FVSTASSCGVTASGMSEIAPTVPWIVSSRVRPVKTRIVSVFSASVRVAQDWMSLLSGTFSDSQNFPVRRSDTSSSIGATTRFQLMASTCDARVRFSNAFALPKAVFAVRTSCLHSTGTSYARAHCSKRAGMKPADRVRSEEHTSELQSRFDLVCRLLLEKKKIEQNINLQRRL